ncbi:uncharacterized protein LOC129588569 isoform X2 [Paramacrobiotus metropolitanus]|nr:uncharacterized protein LOC129588569 isoform X2 [Paramacrobiotus metropolitanus]
MTPQSAPGAGSGGSGGRSGYTYRRDDDRDREGFWRPWIGMGKKAEGLSYHHARTSAYRTDDCDYSRDRDYNYNNTTRTNTYVRNYDGDLGLGGRLGTDYRGGYGYQNTGEYNDGYGKYDDSFHRDDRGWSSSTMTNRYDGNRYTIGEKMMDGGYFNSSANNWDRPTNGGAGIRDRDNIRGYSHININW